MPIRVWLVLACLCFSGSVSAAMVELVFDVQLVQRSVGRLVDGVVLKTHDEDFAPKNFAMTVRFDMSPSSSSKADLPLYGFSDATAIFPTEGASLTDSPFTSSLLAKVPGLVDPLSMQFATVRTVLWGEEFDSGTNRATINTWSQQAGQPRDRTSLYYRAITLYAGTGYASRYDVDLLAGQSLLDWLTTEVGRPFFARYEEGYQYEAEELRFDENGLEISATLLDYDSISYQGGMILRSVTEVPLPAVGMALPLLLGMGFAAKRYRRRNPR